SAAPAGQSSPSSPIAIIVFVFISRLDPSPASRLVVFRVRRQSPRIKKLGVARSPLLTTPSQLMQPAVATDRTPISPDGERTDRSADSLGSHEAGDVSTTTPAVPLGCCRAEIALS